MVQPAHITITRGPDRGNTYRLTEELVNVGRGPECQILLTDPSVEDHHASIVRRNGRYAISTPLDNVLEVDGNAIPSERWVWLPASAQIRISKSTSFLFRCETESEPPGLSRRDGTDARESDPTPQPPRKAKRKRKGQPAVKTRKIAQFITDQEGDHLVRLGEDGSLPELSLAESQRKSAAEARRTEKSPALLYIALGVSLLLSLAMMFVDSGAGGSSASERARARKKIESHFGDDKAELQTYQRYLRKARRAYSIDDRKAERLAYQQVLYLLNAEDVNAPLKNLTGDKKRDDELRRLIGILLDR